jgi:hypothetical protein|tara:strand:+ start:1207 stop:1449 length:243 start_codon:yes stop_codon:yes gene_type:complete
VDKNVKKNKGILELAAESTTFLKEFTNISPKVEVHIELTVNQFNRVMGEIQRTTKMIDESNNPQVSVMIDGINFIFKLVD